MTSIKLKTRVYQQISHLSETQLEELSKLIEQEFSPKAEATVQKRVGGKYKGQFVIKNDFDEMPDEFMDAFTKE